jgi:glycosyltransferase involved in cell wall biosynthesis/CelD/BcsL family acetyltransferase involved in cellulose biosynthesis
VTLTILIVAPPFSTIGPQAVGGAEQVIAALDAALVAAGHRSLVLACGGSEVRGRLLPLPRQDDPTTTAAHALARGRLRAALEQALRDWPVDLVHLHGADFHHYLPPAGPPALVTLHAHPAQYPEEALRPRRPFTYLHCVSPAQRLACPPGTALIGDIPGGVDLERLRPRERKGDFALALGRFAAEKGLRVALEAAALADMPLLLAGRALTVADVRHFAADLAPRLDARRRCLGVLSEPARRRLLARARCVVVPSLTPSACSLVAMEALASGTPVVASALGSLPELIEDGRTGFVVPAGDVEAFARAMRDCAELRPEDCRRAAEERLGLARMTDGFLEAYARLSRPVSSSRPQAHAAVEVEVEEASGVAALEALRPEWAALWERSPRAGPYDRPEWLLPWCERLGPLDPWALSVRRGGRLVALLLLARYRHGRQRTACLLGSADEPRDLLVDPVCEEEALRALVTHLARRRDRWDLLDLDALTPGSPLLALRPGPGWREELQAVGARAALALPASVEALPAALPPITLLRVRAARRRLARRSGALSLSVAGDDLPEALDALLRLRRLEDHGVRKFHADAAAALHWRGALRLHTLRVGGRIVAVAHLLLDRRRAVCHLLACDPALRARGAADLVLFAAAEDAIRAGAGMLDLPADVDLVAWGARSEPLLRRRLRLEPAELRRAAA